MKKEREWYHNFIITWLSLIQFKTYGKFYTKEAAWKNLKFEFWMGLSQKIRPFFRLACFFISNTRSDIKIIFLNIWLIKSTKNDKLIITKNSV